MATKKEIEALTPGSWVRLKSRWSPVGWVEIIDPTVQKIVGRNAEGDTKDNVSVVKVALPDSWSGRLYSIEDISSRELYRRGDGITGISRGVFDTWRAVVYDYAAYPSQSALIETRDLDVSEVLASADEVEEFKAAAAESRREQAAEDIEQRARVAALFEDTVFNGEAFLARGEVSARGSGGVDEIRQGLSLFEGIDVEVTVQIEGVPFDALFGHRKELNNG